MTGKHSGLCLSVEGGQVEPEERTDTICLRARQGSFDCWVGKWRTENEGGTGGTG